MALPGPERPRFRGTLAQFIAQAGPGHRDPVALQAAYRRATGRPVQASMPRLGPLPGGTLASARRTPVAPAPAAAPAPSAPAAPAPEALNDPYSGLPSLAQQYLKSFAPDTQAGADYISQGYAGVAGQARSDNAAAQSQISNLVSLMGSGYAPGSVQEQASKQQASIMGALSASSGSRFPGSLEAAGQSAAQSYRLGRSADQAKFLGDTFATQQKTASDQAALEMDDQKNRQSLAAQLRGQNLSLLAAKISAGGALTRAELASTTQLETNAQDNATSIQNTNTRTAAQERIAAQRAAAAAKKAKGKAKAGRPGTPQYASARTSYTNNLRKDFYRDQPDFATDDQGNIKTDVNGKPIKLGTTSSQPYNTDAQPSIVRGLALGLKPAHVLAALRGVDPGYGSDRRDIDEFMSALKQSGFKPGAIKTITKGLFGSNNSTSGTSPLRGLW